MKRKFRAWDKINSEMCTVLTIDYQVEEVLLSDNYDGAWSEFDDIVLLQSTGLKDKKGVEIFEHDILKNGRGEIGQVIYLQQEAGFVVSLKKRDYRLGHRNTGEGYRTADYHTVIGNVCENPELLEVQE